MNIFILNGAMHLDKMLTLLPSSIYDELMVVAEAHLSQIEEIRIRVNRPLEVAFGQEVLFGKNLVTAEMADQFLNRISQFSFYMLDEQLRRGYITVAGGHRIGLAGKVVLENGFVKGLREISSFNIRIAREKIGVAEKLISALFQKKWLSTLILGPPQSGKTTYLRDIARLISQGEKGVEARKVGIVDERSEIAGCVGGVPQLTFGSRLDVLDGCPKAEGMMMLIRSMSPEVIIADEIGRVEDIEAIREAVNAGISLITSVHGENLEDVMRRPNMRTIIDEGVFKRVIVLSRKDQPGFVVGIHELVEKGSSALYQNKVKSGNY